MESVRGRRSVIGLFVSLKSPQKYSSIQVHFVILVFQTHYFASFRVFDMFDSFYIWYVSMHSLAFVSRSVTLVVDPLLHKAMEDNRRRIDVDHCYKMTSGLSWMKMASSESSRMPIPFTPVLDVGSWAASPRSLS